MGWKDGSKWKGGHRAERTIRRLPFGSVMVWFGGHYSSGAHASFKWAIDWFLYIDAFHSALGNI